ncbi:MAG: hypothetical protein LBQ13_03855 [Endomicrobium sp.]|jgi:hypothetical protein|nr:hypothetical protein [Endomicrobium sp.]
MSKFFTISIGDSYSVLSIRNKKKIFQQFFFEAIDDGDAKKTLENVFKKNSKLSIYIILDSVGQNYSKRKFPAVGYFDVSKMVNRKFEHEIPKEDLKEKIYLGKSPETKEWEYMFVSSPINDYLQEWLNFVEHINNILVGIYMLPLEFENILKNINKKVNPKKKKGIVTKHGWTVMLIKSKVSGYREMTFTDERLTFTRVLQDDLIDSADGFASNFRDNMSKVIDYLKRFYPNFSANELTIYIIAGAKEKDMINKSSLKEFRIRTFSFLEVASIFNLNKDSYKDDQYGDILFQDLIIRNKKIASFSTNEMKQLNTLSTVNKISSKLIIALMVILVILTALSLILLTKNRLSVVNIKSELKVAEEKLENKKKNQFSGTKVEDIDKIIDITSFYVNSAKIGEDPFDFLAKFSEISSDNIIVNSVVWRINNFRKNNFVMKYDSIYQIDSILINRSGKIDDLFKLYENVDRAIKNSFKNQTIKMSSLPKNIDFNTNYFSFPLKIDVTENSK